MTDRKSAMSIQGVFNGIYEWGEGFVSYDIQQAWNWFWKVEFPKRHFLFWKYAEGDDFGGCGHLSGLCGSIYMHPMNFKATLVSDTGVVKISPCEGKDYICSFASEIRELKKICDEAAEYCGGQFVLYISPEYYIETQRPSIIYDKDLAVSEFGMEKKENEYIY